jgi:hypothetical protein
MPPQKKPQPIWLGLIVSASLLLTACPNAPLGYKLQRWGTISVLVPPNQRSTNENSGLLISNLKNARRKSTSLSCDTEGSVVALHWHGKALEIRVKAESYVAERTEASQSRGEVSGMYLDPLQDVGTFHAQLLQLESKGCFNSIEARRIRRAVAERFPLPPSIAYRYQLGSYDTTGFFELTPDFRLEVVSPIYDSDGPQTVEHQTGYEVAYYGFRSPPNDSRVTASLTSIAEFHPSQPSIPKNAPRNKVDFPTSPNYFHLLFKTEKTPARHVTRAFLLSSTDDLQLDTGTKQLQAASVDTCEVVSTSGVKCIGFPPNFGVSVELRVRVNHKETFVQLDGTVLDALGLKNLSAEVPKNLRVTRLFQGRPVRIVFDSTKKDILALTLMPGDEITW